MLAFALYTIIALQESPPADWQRLMPERELPAVFEFSESSIRRTSRGMEIWARVNEVRYDADLARFVSTGHHAWLSIIDCRGRRITTARAVSFDLQGNRKAGENADVAKVEAIADGSIGDLLSKVACKGGEGR